MRQNRAFLPHFSGILNGLHRREEYVADNLHMRMKGGNK